MLEYQNGANASDVLAEYVFQTTMVDFVASAAHHVPDNPHIFAQAVAWMVERGEVFLLAVQTLELLRQLDWWPAYAVAVEHQGIMHCAASPELLSHLVTSEN